MSRDSRLEASASAARTIAGEVPDAQASQAVESAEGRESSLRIAPARGILNAMVIGAGAWTIIFGAAALARAIFFG
jgi:hypothetical protein